MGWSKYMSRRYKVETSSASSQTFASALHLGFPEKSLGGSTNGDPKEPVWNSNGWMENGRIFPRTFSRYRFGFIILLKQLFTNGCFRILACLVYLLTFRWCLWYIVLFYNHPMSWWLTNGDSGFRGPGWIKNIQWFLANSQAERCVFPWLPWFP